MVRVVCAGHVNWDVTLRTDRLPDRDGEASVRERVAGVGGSAANVAAGLAQLGVDVDLVGSVGTDPPGRRALRDLDALGVDCSAVRQVTGATAVKYIVVDRAGEVMVFAAAGENEAFTTRDLQQGTFDHADILHLTSQAPETARGLAERAVAAGVRVTFDPGRGLEDRDYAGVFDLADIVFVNGREAAMLPQGLPGDSGCVVVTKRGADGAIVCTERETITHEGFTVDPVDTTGAGDAFAAGFLASVEDRLAHAAAVGNACGCIASTRLGAGVELSWEAVDAVLDTEP